MGSQWFTVLDQGKAHHQGNVSESSKPVTAFVTPWGLYEWNRIPFGLTGAPGRFQKYMNEILNDNRDRFCIPYLDDIIIYSSTFEGHLNHLRAVLRRLKEKGIKLKPMKCELFRKTVRYLGCMITEQGYMMDPKDKDAVLQLKDRMLNYMYDSSLVSLAIFESTSLTFPGGLRHCMTCLSSWQEDFK